MNKSVITNLVALVVTAGGYFSPVYPDIILMTGLFALSGGITNWLAVHMLFEKVPLLYGSGVIPDRFEEFKAAIKQLIIQEFFTREHIERFFNQNDDNSFIAISDKIDFDHIFDGLLDAIEESKLGIMLSMFGGKKALQPLREPIIEKLKGIIAELISNPPENGNSDSENDGGRDLLSVLIGQVERIIDNRLEELTPERVKKIVQDMVHKHLGWLVVWGAVFGGVIGLVVSIVGYLS